MSAENKLLPEHYGLDFFKRILQCKWQINILYYLAQNINQPGELHKKIPKASRRIINLHLCQLEKFGVVTRKVHNQSPPKVEYLLTKLGSSIIPIILVIESWGECNKQEIIDINGQYQVKVAITTDAIIKRLKIDDRYRHILSL